MTAFLPKTKFARILKNVWGIHFKSGGKYEKDFKTPLNEIFAEFAKDNKSTEDKPLTLMGDFNVKSEKLSKNIAAYNDDPTNDYVIEVEEITAPEKDVKKKREFSNQTNKNRDGENGKADKAGKDFTLTVKLTKRAECNEEKIAIINAANNKQIPKKWAYENSVSYPNHPLDHVPTFAIRDDKVVCAANVVEEGFYDLKEQLRDGVEITDAQKNYKLAMRKFFEIVLEKTGHAERDTSNFKDTADFAKAAADAREDWLKESKIDPDTLIDSKKQDATSKVKGKLKEMCEAFYESKEWGEYKECWKEVPDLDLEKLFSQTRDKKTPEHPFLNDDATKSLGTKIKTFFKMVAQGWFKSKGADAAKDLGKAREKDSFLETSVISGTKSGFTMPGGYQELMEDGTSAEELNAKFEKSQCEALFESVKEFYNTLDEDEKKLPLVLCGIEVDPHRLTGYFMQELEKACEKGMTDDINFEGVYQLAINQQLAKLAECEGKANSAEGYKSAYSGVADKEKIKNEFTEFYNDSFCKPIKDAVAAVRKEDQSRKSKTTSWADRFKPPPPFSDRVKEQISCNEKQKGALTNLIDAWKDSDFRAGNLLWTMDSVAQQAVTGK